MFAERAICGHGGVLRSAFYHPSHKVRNEESRSDWFNWMKWGCSRSRSPPARSRTPPEIPPLFSFVRKATTVYIREEDCRCLQRVITYTKTRQGQREKKTACEGERVSWRIEGTTLADRARRSIRVTIVSLLNIVGPWNKKRRKGQVTALFVE